MPEQQVQQLYKMARDCLDRGQAIFISARKEQRPLALFRLATPSPTVSPTLPNQQFPLHPSLSAQQPHPPSQTARHTSQTLPKMRAAEPPQNSRVAPQNPGTSRTGHGSSSERNMSWPASRRVPTLSSRKQVGGFDTTDGIPGGSMGQPRGQGKGKSEQYRSQPIK